MAIVLMKLSYTGIVTLTKITNRQCDNGKKILLIHDSYATAVAPFLATTCQELHMIDVRKENGNFNGNLSAYIDEFQPDLVLFSFCSPSTLIGLKSLKRRSR